MESLPLPISPPPSASVATSFTTLDDDDAAQAQVVPAQNLDGFLRGVELRAWRLAEYATGNRDDALDIVQDAMFKLASRYADKPASEWPALFHRILQNQIRDHQRRQKLRSGWRWLTGQDGEDAGLRQPAPSHEQPAPELERDHARQQLDHALRQLPERQRQVFLLRAWEGLDVKQTAEAIGCSAGSVKTHYSRAVQRLRELMGDFQP